MIEQLGDKTLISLDGSKIRFKREPSPMLLVIAAEGRSECENSKVYFNYGNTTYVVKLAGRAGADIYYAIYLKRIDDLSVFSCSYCKQEIRHRGERLVISQDVNDLSCKSKDCNKNPNKIRTFDFSYKLITSEHFLDRGRDGVEDMLKTYDIISRTCVSILDTNYPDLLKYIDDTRSTGGDSSFLINGRKRA